MLHPLRSRRRILARAILVAAPLLLILGLFRRGSAERFRPPAAESVPSDRGGTAEPFRPPSFGSPFTPPVSSSVESPSARQPTAADEEALLALIADARRETDPAKRHERLVAVCLHWAGFDPPAAIILSAELGLDPLDGQLVPNLAHQWAARDFAAAQTWADRLPAGDLRDQVYSRLAYERATSDPAAAARLLAAMSPVGPAREEATLSVLHAWGLRDPAAARAWAATFPAGPLRERAGLELARTAPLSL